MPETNTTPTTTAPTIQEVAKPAKKVAAKEAKSSLPQRQLESLKALAGGKKMTHTQIAAKTGRPKGNQLRPLTAAGLVKATVQEGVRGHIFELTAAGKKAVKC